MEDVTEFDSVDKVKFVSIDGLSTYVISEYGKQLVI